MARKGGKSLTDLIVTKRSSGGTWFDKLPPDQQQVLLKFREDFKSSGGLAMPTARNLVAHLCVDVCPPVVAKWLRS